MFKTIIFLSLLQVSTFGFGTTGKTAPCDCPTITNLQKTAQTASSFSYSWNGSTTSAYYKVWYVRQEDRYVSGYFYTNSLSYNFTGLTAGHYTFYFQSTCDQESSSFIGIEDTISV